MIDCDAGAELDLSTLRTESFGQHGFSRHDVPSTNDVLWEAAAQGAPHGSICVARAQTAGRGRQSRRWLSPMGAGLYLSLLLRPAAHLVETVASYSLVSALAVAEAVEHRGGIATQLKWPNDVWVDGGKICGILLESRVTSTPTIVLGIGLNLAAPSGGWPDDLAVRATSLQELGVDVGRDALLVDLLESLESSYEQFASEGLGPFLIGWRARSLLTDQTIDVQWGDQRLRVEVLDVDEQGCLVVRTTEGIEKRLNAGEVHLVPRSIS